MSSALAPPRIARCAALGALRALFAVSTVAGVYALSVSTFRPDQLLYPIPGVDHFRTDTTGVVSLTISVACALAVGTFSSESGWSCLRALASRSRPAAERFAYRVLLVIPAYAALGWLYILANSLTHLETMYLPLTHLASGPTEEHFGHICMVTLLLGAAVCFSVGGILIEFDRPSSGRGH